MKRAGVWLAVLAAVASTAAPAGAASSSSAEQRRSEIDQEVAQLRRQVGEAADDEADLIAELTITRRHRKQADVKLAALDAALATAEHDLDGVSAEYDAAIVAEQQAAAALEAAESELAGAEGTLRQQAVEAYIRFGNDQPLDSYVLRVEDVNDAPRVAAYVDTIAAKQAQVVDRFRRAQQDTAELEAAAAQARRDVLAHRDDVAGRKEVLERSRAEQAQARAEVAAEASDEEALLAKVKSQRGAYERRLRELERESSNIANQLRQRQSGQRVTPSGHGVLAYALADPVITSTYGYRVHPIYGDVRLHAGIDLRAATGTPAYSAGAGTVVFAGWKSGYGNTVIIDHGGALATLYGHLDALVVSQGATVRRGQQVGAAGSTGNSTGPHLHFEVRVTGTPVDPMSYL